MSEAMINQIVRQNAQIDRLKAENERLKSRADQAEREREICDVIIDERNEQLQTLTSALEAARWALLKVSHFVPRMFKTGWTDEVQEAIDEARDATRGAVDSNALCEEPYPDE